MVSVGATMNIMLAAVLAEGMTIIENAAKEPHIVDLANFLNSMGANIMGAGTDVIKIRGVERLRGGTYSIIPDQIEAGTYMAAVAAAGGEVLIKNVIPKHLDCITAKLVEMGVDVEELDDAVLVRRTGPISRTNVKTMPYPGFPTDMQPQIAAVLCLATGTSVLTEGVWDNRYRYVDEFRRMGAHIQVDGKVAVIEGVPKLTGAPVHACDLRAGAAMVIAGLAALTRTPSPRWAKRIIKRGAQVRDDCPLRLFRFFCLYAERSAFIASFVTLASGSSGNAALVSCGQTHILLDAGISARRITTGPARPGGGPSRPVRRPHHP